MTITLDQVTALKALIHPDIVKGLDAVSFNWQQFLALLLQLLPVILPFLNPPAPTPTPLPPVK